MSAASESDNNETQVYLPDFCAAGTVFVVVLIAELVAILLTLAAHDTPGLFLVEINRSDQIIGPVGPDQVLQAGDILTFTGLVSTIVDLEKISGLVPVADDGYESQVAERRRHVLCEAVVSPSSPSIGKTIQTAAGHEHEVRE